MQQRMVAMRTIIIMVLVLFINHHASSIEVNFHLCFLFHTVLPVRGGDGCGGPFFSKIVCLSVRTVSTPH